MRTERWRYIRYADGAEELYDMHSDPHEWHNLAGEARHDSQLAKLRRWLPTTNLAPVEGSRHRILTHRDGKVVWEGEEIDAADPIPEL